MLIVKLLNWSASMTESELGNCLMWYSFILWKNVILAGEWTWVYQIHDTTSPLGHEKHAMVNWQYPSLTLPNGYILAMVQGYKKCHINFTIVGAHPKVELSTSSHRKQSLENSSWDDKFLCLNNVLISVLLQMLIIRQSQIRYASW